MKKRKGHYSIRYYNRKDNYFEIHIYGHKKALKIFRKMDRSRVYNTVELWEED